MTSAELFTQMKDALSKKDESAITQVVVDYHKTLEQVEADRDQWQRMYNVCSIREQEFLRVVERYRAGYQGACMTCERGELIDNLEEERDVYAIIAERWWRQARVANRDAWSNARIATAAMETIDELREEVEQYKWLLEQTGDPAPQDVAKQEST